MTVDDELTRLRTAAAAVGVQPGWWDVRGEWHDVGPDALAAVAAVAAGLGPRPGSPGQVAAAIEEVVAADAAPVLAPASVCWVDEPPVATVHLPVGTAVASVALTPDPRCGAPSAQRDVVLADEALSVGQRSGRRAWRVDLSPLAPEGRLPVGRHRLEVRAAGVEGASVLLAAPRRVVPLHGERRWGVVAPAWSLWSSARPEAHLGHLARLAEWVGDLGGTVVATLPLLATFLDRPCDPSPYTPVSRRWWNEVYLDLAARPELRDCPAAADALAAVTPSGGVPSPYDAPAQARAVRAVVDHLARHVDATPGPLHDDLLAFAADDEVVRYGRFRAAVERTGTDWRSWPGDGRDTVEAVAPDAPEVVAHVYAQWAMARQLDRLAGAMRRRGQHLQLDLPVGTHPGGFDTFTHREAFGWGVSVGAPPDDFFEEGQDWGFPPVVPRAGTADGHAVLAEGLAAHMAVAGLLRIDHVMQLQRLYWVPEGAPATEGAYVHQPLEELVATVAIESHLAGCAVVGEDLGTVSDEVRAAMAAHGLAGMYVAQFAQPEGGWLAPPTAQQVASVGTHDTPTFAGWCRGADLDVLEHLGLMAPEEAQRRHVGRRRAVGSLRDALVERGVLAHDVDDPASSSAAAVRTHAGLLELLGASDAEVVLVSLEDLLGELEPINVPGTPPDRPNWVVRAPVGVGQLVQDPEVLDALARLHRARAGTS